MRARRRANADTLRRLMEEQARSLLQRGASDSKVVSIMRGRQCVGIKASRGRVGPCMWAQPPSPVHDSPPVCVRGGPASQQRALPLAAAWLRVHPPATAHLPLGCIHTNHTRRIQERKLGLEVRPSCGAWVLRACRHAGALGRSSLPLIGGWCGHPGTPCGGARTLLAGRAPGRPAEEERAAGHQPDWGHTGGLLAGLHLEH